MASHGLTAWRWSHFAEDPVTQETCVRLRELALTFASHEITKAVVHTLVMMPSAAVKQRSYSGFVWMGKKLGWKDQGNYWYMVLFKMMQATTMYGDHVFSQELLMFEARWPSISTGSQQGWSLAGDIIECILAETYECGPAVPLERQRVLLELQALAKQICLACDRLDHCTFRGDGPPRNADRCKPQDLVNLIILGAALHDTRSEVIRQRHIVSLGGLTQLIHAQHGDLP